jgi:UDP-N-acetylmuramyl pentapeptide phosphotransferase/UDP-N-acetylglucosamine-1-phosphate transferase
MSVALLLIGLVTCWIVTALALSLKLGQKQLDLPNQRSLHTIPTPRIGGLCLLVSTAFVGALAVFFVSAPVFEPLLLTIAAAAFALACAGAFDDAYGLSVKLRLVLQFAVSFAISVYFATLGLFTNPKSPLQWTSALLPQWPNDLQSILALNAPITLAFFLICSVLAVGIIWAINLYNFMDGANGMAGLSALVGLTSYCLIGASESSNHLPLLGLWIVIGAIVGFLIFNLRGTIFLGDAGSTSFGFLACCVGLLGIAQGYWRWTLPLVAFGPLIFDATLTLFYRWRRHEKLSQAHSTHIYQKLIKLGQPHWKISTAYAVVALLAVIIHQSVEPSPNWVRQTVQYGVVLSYVGAFFMAQRWINAKTTS